MSARAYLLDSYHLGFGENLGEIIVVNSTIADTTANTITPIDMNVNLYNNTNINMYIHINLKII